MARTLQQLKESVEKLITQQGEDAPVAAFIFTNNDVFVVDDDCNQDTVVRDIAETVLNEIEGNDWIYEQIFNLIEDELKQIH